MVQSRVKRSKIRMSLIPVQLPRLPLHRLRPQIPTIALSLSSLGWMMMTSPWTGAATLTTWFRMSIRVTRAPTLVPVEFRPRVSPLLPFRLSVT